MIVYLPGALGDLRRIVRWYSTHRPGYEDRFFERLRATLARIERAPSSFPVVIDDEVVRRARVLRSPYLVAFLVLGPDVHIVAVMHGARDPKKLARRVRAARP